MKNRRKDLRHEIVANFQFVVGDKPDDVCEGITINISNNGFGFLTETGCKEGQDIMVTKHDVPRVAGQEATVMWVKKGPIHYNVGVKFVTD